MKAYTLNVAGFRQEIHVSRRGVDGQCVYIGPKVADPTTYVWVDKQAVCGTGLDSHLEHACLLFRGGVPVLTTVFADDPKGVIILVSNQVPFVCDPRFVVEFIWDRLTGWMLLSLEEGASFATGGTKEGNFWRVVDGAIVGESPDAQPEVEEADASAQIVQDTTPILVRTKGETPLPDGLEVPAMVTALAEQTRQRVIVRQNASIYNALGNAILPAEIAGEYRFFLVTPGTEIRTGANGAGRKIKV